MAMIIGLAIFIQINQDIILKNETFDIFNMLAFELNRFFYVSTGIEVSLSIFRTYFRKL